MEKSVLTEVKAILKSLVISCPDKITIEKLNRDYQDVEGQCIPYRQLGYGNLEQFLHSLPDTLRVFGSGPSAMVCFVANEKTDHIHDMIMKQKKPKSKVQSRSMSNSSVRNISNVYNGSNSRVPTNKIRGQQLSPYQSVNRKQTPKTPQVKTLQQMAERSNYMPIRVANQSYYLPQPNGIVLNPVLCTVQNGIVKSVRAHNQHCQNQLNSLLKNQCHVSNPPPPPLSRSQNRNVSFSTERKPSIHVESNVKSSPVHLGPKRGTFETIVEKELKIGNSNIKKTSGRDTKKSPIQIKPPIDEKQVSMNFSAEAEDILKLCEPRNNHKEPSKYFSAQGPREPENIQNAKTMSSVQPKRFFDVSADYAEDPDEAIPSFAAKNNVFRLDFPECTVSYGNKIVPYKLPSHITVGSCLRIFISEIHSPFKFWFHIHKEDHELDSLMYQIERYYSSLDPEDLCIPMVCLIPGQVCAACYNGLWHRAEIVTPPVNKTIKVSFMDYGTVACVETQNVKFLATAFAQLPAQALRGCLSHIKPRQYHWSHDATNHFLALVAELMLYAKISEIDTQNNVLYMILCDTNGDEVVQINSSLVNKGYAFYNEEWKTEKIRQNNGERLRHPREDFPTFSMIESGEYPNFHDLVSMKERGIEYETIYDNIIYNQSTILNKQKCASEGLKKLPYFLTTSNPFRTEILLELYATTSKAL